MALKDIGYRIPTKDDKSSAGKINLDECCFFIKKRGQKKWEVFEINGRKIFSRDSESRPILKTLEKDKNIECVKFFKIEIVFLAKKK